MKLHTDRKDDNKAIVEITASTEELAKIKTKVLNKLAPSVKMSGFREGKAPISMIEKSVDQEKLQTEFINEAINTLYIAALKEDNLRPVEQPKVEVKKFVPFSTLEIVLEIPVVGEIKLPDYKKTSAKRKPIKVAANEINQVLENLRTRSADKKKVDRAAKKDDEAVIDFKGTDTKGEAVKGADGKDYPLVIGSKTFIPGFEENIEGMKVGEEKSFDVTFPKDYGAKALQSKKVNFKVKLNKLNEIVKPKIDDKFASTIGPFESLDQLKADIKKQLQAEADQKVERDYESELVNEISDKTKVKIPEVLINEQVEAVKQELRQNVVQRGMTYDEYIASSGMSEEEYAKKEIVPEAERRVKAGLVLSEIADKEGIVVTEKELETRLEQLKSQYKDEKMQAELDKNENKREIAARLRTEKTINFLKK